MQVILIINLLICLLFHNTSFCLHTKHKSDFTDNEFGQFLAGLIEGDGWFGNKQLHIIFSIDDSPLAYLIKKRIGHGNV